MERELALHARAALQEPERQLRKILDAIPLYVGQVGRDGKILFANRAWEAAIGPCVGSSIRTIIPERLGSADYESCQSLRGRVQKGIAVESTEELILPNLGRRTLLVHQIPDIRAEGEEIGGWFVVGVDVTEKRRTEEERLAEERRLRDALVTEVHHRVKNSLQGVVGLLRTQLMQHPNLAPILDPAIAQVLAVSVGFGLMSRKNRPGVILCDMVREIAANLEQITGAAIETAFDDSIAREPVALDGEQAVNTALVLNELLFNALKHGVPRDGRITVGVRLSREAETATVRIFSAGATLPAAFDFQMGSGLGTGLSLVRLLLQPDALKLSLASTPAGVEAILQVRSLARRQPPGPLQPR